MKAKSKRPSLAESFHLTPATGGFLFDALAEYVRTLFYNAPWGMALVDYRGVIREANRSALSLSRLERKEIVGKSLEQIAFTLRADAGRVRTAFQAALQGKAPEGYEFTFTRRPNEKAVAVARHVPIPGNGAPAGLMVLVEDITVRRWAEAALLQQEEEAARSRNRLASMLGAMSDLVFEFDRQGRFRFCHIPPGGGLYRPPKYFIGKRHGEVMPPHVHRLFSGAFQRCRAGETAEYEYHLDDGKKRGWFAAKLSPEFEDGKFGGAVALVRDVSARRRAEEELKASEEKYRLVSENIPVVIYSALPDEHSTNLYVSGQARKLTGYSEAEFMADPTLFSRIIHPEDRGRVWEKIKEHRRKKGPLDIQYRILTKEKAIKWVRDKATPMLDDRGRFARIVGFMEDITAAKTLEERLFRAQKMEVGGRIASSLVHDINTLLFAISGFVELVSKNLPGGKSNRDLHGIRQAVKRAAALTERLLAFSRNKKPRLRKVNLKVLVHGLCPLLTRLLGRRIALELRLAPGLTPVRADPGQMQQVLANLVVNAREAMPEGGRLAIESKSVILRPGAPLLPPGLSPGPYVLLAISDTGVGMDDETRCRVFEPFFTTKDRSRNAGLGLSIVYSIVKECDGHVEVASEPGRGTTFRIFLPVAPRRA